MLFENNDFDLDLMQLSGLTFNTQDMYGKNDFSMEKGNALLTSKEGFLRGNMWKDEYESYKGMNFVALVPTCEREALLYKIMETSFAINDLNLYLDLHPEDYAIYSKFKSYVEECIKLTDEYAKKYGPLTLENTTGANYNWLNNPWPWDKSGGSLYV